jgi:hypothetical protein
MTNKDNTTVNQVDINLDELLGTPGAENITVPESKNEQKPSLFSRKENVDLSFLDNNDNDDDDENTSDTNSKTEDGGADSTSGEAAKPKEKISKEDFESILDDASEETTETTKKGGRHNGLVELANKLIEKGLLTPFEGEEDITKYSVKDFEELFEANSTDKTSKTKEEVSAEFFESLPNELQVAAHYVANGGSDLKSLFRSLAAVEEIRELDTKDETSQEQIVRSYLHATNFGDAEEIEEEIEAWKDRDELEAKANKFKPKLDAMQEQIVARQLQQQEQMRKQQQLQAQKYTDNIYKALEPGELNGLKLDKKTQNVLFAGLTQANYPSMSGRSTNLLGHLLEKYQYAEPNHALISEALWLLSDPEGYRSKVKEGGKKEAVEKTVRQLKTEQSNKITSGTGSEESESQERRKTTGVARPTGGSFFKR